KVNSSKVYIRVDDEERVRAVNKALKILLNQYKGDTSVYLVAAKERKSFRLARECWIDLDTEVMDFLKEKFGEANVKLIDEE
ncbi:MAG: OB-fold nucleic acid binding domain-containing protein, partial [Sarcina sp.]